MGVLGWLGLTSQGGLETFTYVEQKGPAPCPAQCHPAISFSVIPFFSCSQSLPASAQKVENQPVMQETWV